MDMVKFIDTIICCSIPNLLSSKVIDQEALSVILLLSKNISYKALLASLNKTNKEFALKLYKNSNSITFKMQIHSFFIMQLVLNMAPLSAENVDLIFHVLVLKKQEY